jgi:hypothetical protein
VVAFLVSMGSGISVPKPSAGITPDPFLRVSSYSEGCRVLPSFPCAPHLYAGVSQKGEPVGLVSGIKRSCPASRRPKIKKHLNVRIQALSKAVTTLNAAPKAWARTIRFITSTVSLDTGLIYMRLYIVSYYNNVSMLWQHYHLSNRAGCGY